MIPSNLLLKESNNSSKRDVENKPTGFKLFLTESGVRRTAIIENNVLLFFVYSLSHQLINDHENINGPQLAQPILTYKQHLEDLLKEGKILPSERQQYLYSLDFYIRYLRTKNIYVPLDNYLLNQEVPHFDDLGCAPLREYIEELCRLNKLCVTTELRNIKSILKLLDPEIRQNIRLLTQTHLTDIENHFLKRIDEETILSRSAYYQLNVLRRFLRFLKRNQYIYFDYVIPEQFDSTVVRENSFVTNEDRMSFLNGILQDQYSPFQKRDLCVVLLIMFTGCRPIEICTLRIQDVLKTESRIYLYSLKSSQRSIQLEKEVMLILRSYINKQRNGASLIDPLFVTGRGMRIETKHISSIFNKYNRKIFGMSKVSARALRHTFITSALDDHSGNELTEVSRSVGHSDLRSTMHYYYRNIKRLVSNALPYLT
ncbi:tyrosine-type recombinase/integrase [Paenibacillus andongensis]|uniref:tyrosine-type recombinase/integrase n=1 Tax=Paenibacillus andongensis TaxID=2975482 RepID=UPI0021BB0A8A|nr:site-specific integrase [Paenibacillus andongensis]